MSQDGMLPLQPLPRPDQRGQLLTKSDTIWVSFRRERMRLSGQAGVRVTRICHGGAQTGVKRVRTRTHERAPTQMTEAGSLLTGHDPARTRGIRPYLSLTARLARRKMIEADGLGPPPAALADKQEVQRGGGVAVFLRWRAPSAKGGGGDARLSSSA